MILTVSEATKLLLGVLREICGLPEERVREESAGGWLPPEAERGELSCSLRWKEYRPLAQNAGEYAAGSGGGEAEDILTQHLRHEARCAVRVSFWGPGALPAAARAVGALQNDNRNFDLWRVLGPGGIDKIWDESGASGGTGLNRYCFNLQFYACFGAAYPVDWFNASRWGLAGTGEAEQFALGPVEAAAQAGRPGPAQAQGDKP